MGIHDSAYPYADYIINKHNEMQEEYKKELKAQREVKNIADYFIIKYERFNQKYPLDIQRLCYLVFLSQIEHYKVLGFSYPCRYYKNNDKFITGANVYTTIGGPAFVEIFENYAQTGEPVPYFLRNVPESEYNCQINKNKYCGPTLVLYEENLELLDEYSKIIFNKTRNISTENLCKGFLEVKELNPKKDVSPFSSQNIISKEVLKKVARDSELYDTLYKYQDESADAKAQEPTSK